MWGSITVNCVRIFRLVGENVIFIANITGRHEAYFKSKDKQTVVDPSSGTTFEFLRDELVRVEVSHKVRSNIPFTIQNTMLRFHHVVLGQRRLRSLCHREPAPHSPLD